MGHDLTAINPAPPPTSLAPGFRFHPTDEELVQYYLKRKACGKPFRFEAVSEIDVYKSEPCELAGHSRLKSRDLEWYFFSPVDRKYGNGSRLNRATGQGYWKATGKDRSVRHKGKTIGMKKTLVFHSGRAPVGERTNWVMHEYRLIDEDSQRSAMAQDAFVLCRIFEKSGLGPPNGDRYAPFIEEEWDDDAALVIPGEAAVDDIVNGDDTQDDGNELEQDTHSIIKTPLQLELQNESPNVPLFAKGRGQRIVQNPSLRFIIKSLKIMIQTPAMQMVRTIQPQQLKIFVSQQQQQPLIFQPHSWNSPSWSLLNPKKTIPLTLLHLMLLISRNLCLLGI